MKVITVHQNVERDRHDKGRCIKYEEWASFLDNKGNVYHPRKVGEDAKPGYSAFRLSEIPLLHSEAWDSDPSLFHVPSRNSKPSTQGVGIQ